MLLSYLFRHKSGVSLTFTILFSLISLIWQSNILSSTTVRAVAVLDFFSETFYSIGKGMERVFDSYRSFTEIKRERDALRSQLQEALSTQVNLKRLQLENEKLRQILTLPIVHNQSTIAAEIISQDPDNWFRTIIINKGKKDGIEPYMPVMAFQTIQGKKDESPKVIFGVVGKVIQVNSNSARILPILDQFSQVGVQVEKSGHWALMLGRNPQNRYPLLKYTSLNVILKEGDLIVTSGGDGIFPPGLPIGKVRGKISRQGTFQTAEVEPAIDFKRLNFLLVIKKTSDNHNLTFPELTPSNVNPPPQGNPEPVTELQNNPAPVKPATPDKVQTTPEAPAPEPEKNEEEITP